MRNRPDTSRRATWCCRSCLTPSARRGTCGCGHPYVRETTFRIPGDPGQSMTVQRGVATLTNILGTLRCTSDDIVTCYPVRAEQGWAAGIGLRDGRVWAFAGLEQGTAHGIVDRITTWTSGRAQPSPEQVRAAQRHVTAERPLAYHLAKPAADYPFPLREGLPRRINKRMRVLPGAPTFDLFPRGDVDVSACPYCSIELAPPPAMRAPCPVCERMIWPRSPIDGVKRLLTDTAIAEVEDQWAEWNAIERYLDLGDCPEEELPTLLGRLAGVRLDARLSMRIKRYDAMLEEAQQGSERGGDAG